MGTDLLVFLAAYLIGAIPFGLLIGKLFGVRDIRAFGSGNIGATNVVRVIGMQAGIWVYLLDIAKGFAAVQLARSFPSMQMPLDLFLVIAAALAVLGHVFPVYLAFVGGKGVNTALGVLLALMPSAGLFALAVFVVVLLVTKYVSLGSMLASIALVAFTLWQQAFQIPPPGLIYCTLAVLLMVLVLLTHRTNLARLRAGTESKFSLRRRSGEAHPR